MRFFLLLLMVLTAVLPAWGAPVSEPTPGGTLLGDGVIVPGQRVGPLRMTMTLPQLLDAAGAGYKRDEFPKEKIILYEWRAQGIWISLDLGTKTLRLISAFGANSKYRTDKYVRLLDPFTKAESVYGKNYKRWQYKEDKIILIRYPEIGLQFSVVDDPSQPLVRGRIFQIGIFKPGDLLPVRQP